MLDKIARVGFRDSGGSRLIDVSGSERRTSGTDCLKCNIAADYSGPKDVSTLTLSIL
jgi:hypothetical protein